MTTRFLARTARLLAAAAVLTAAAAPRAIAQHLLVPMDDDQRNHLKAYGLTFNVLKEGMKS